MGNPTPAQRSRSAPGRRTVHSGTVRSAVSVRTTPARLRAWTAATVLLAAASAGTLTATVADTQRGIHRVGQDTAPQAQVASDLYFALSDLDAQTARTILTIGNDDLSGAQLDAQLTFNRRLSDIDADLRQAIGGATDPTIRQTFRQMLDDVAEYHELSSAAQWLDTISGDTPTGKSSALACYSRATDLLHFGLLPTAGGLRDTYAAQLSQSADDEHSAVQRDEILSAVAGVALLGVLVGFQLTLRHRFRRSLSPFLAAATVATAALLGSGLLMSSHQSDRLQTSVTDHMTPYLAIQRSRAVAYDATGAVVRHVVAPRFGYDKGFAADSAALRGPDGQGLIASGLRQSDPALARTADGDWQAVAADADQVEHAVGRDDLATALATATGISRGQLAMDFYALDVHLGQAAAVHRAAFDAGLADARDGAAGWAGLPGAVLLLVAALTLAGVRPRLSEYR